MSRRLTVIAPIHNESENVHLLVERTAAVARQLVGWELELLLVDDGSTDATIQRLDELRAQGLGVGYLRLSRNCGHQAALQAGLMAAQGDAVISMDGDLQHPPEYIPQMLSAFEAGADIVQMVRKQQARGQKGLFSHWFYQFFRKATGVHIVPNACDFRLLSRRSLDALNRIPEREKFFRGLIPTLGFKQVTMEYDEAKRLHGRASFTFKKSLRLAVKALFDFSTLPLRAVFYGGLLIAILSFLWGVGSVIWKLAYWHYVEPGYTDIIVAILFFGGCMLLSVGVLGRYMIMILEQVRGRPSFIIMDYALPAPLAQTSAPTNRPRPETTAMAS